MLFKECLLSIFFEFMESCFLSSDLNHIQDGHIRGCSWIGGGGGGGVAGGGGGGGLPKICHTYPTRGALD